MLSLPVHNTDSDKLRRKGLRRRPAHSWEHRGQGGWGQGGWGSGTAWPSDHSWNQAGSLSNDHGGWDFDETMRPDPDRQPALLTKLLVHSTPMAWAELGRVSPDSIPKMRVAWETYFRHCGQILTEHEDLLRARAEASTRGLPVTRKNAVGGLTEEVVAAAEVVGETGARAPLRAELLGVTGAGISREAPPPPRAGVEECAPTSWEYERRVTGALGSWRYERRVTGALGSWGYERRETEALESWEYERRVNGAV
ncbi:hypothetical protein B0H14DRAFT_3425657 [Mycena olivaceomarginata]|nr:hypothetical protein B0H14DRAFT_3425657 [Mycena olivaceomarginata]